MFNNDKLQILKRYLDGKSASVIGIGISNIPLIDFLLKNNVKVIARDKRSMDDIISDGKIDSTALLNSGVVFITGKDYLEDINEDILFKTPGLRYDVAQILDYAKSGGIVTSEMELFLYLCPCKIFAVTGSDGKTTTTTLIAKLLEASGKKVYLGGNIGKPLLSEIQNITSDDYAVLELSSFQLHALNKFENKGFPFKELVFPDVAIITNVSPNHLNWHPDMNEYIDAKKSIFKFMGSGGKLVTNMDCEITSNLYKEFVKNGGEGVLISLSGNEKAHYYYKNGYICCADQQILSSNNILAVGMHNIDNYMTAIAATSGYVSSEDILSVAKTFPGVEHRIEFVKEINGVKFYNSSIDSSPTRTTVALNSFPDKKNIIILLGGYDKQIPFDGLGKEICRRCKAAFITGDTAMAIKKEIESCNEFANGSTKLFMCENWDEAMDRAISYAKPCDVVLLSPACASFDAFKNFEHRGNVFKQKVYKL